MTEHILTTWLLSMRCTARSSRRWRPSPNAPAGERWQPMPSGAGLEPVAGPAAPATRLRDAVAAARITPGPPPSRTRFDEPDLQRRVLNWVRGQRLIPSFDPQRPKYELR